MFSCEAESAVTLSSLRVCGGFLPSVFWGKAFGSDRQNPMNYSNRGPDEARFHGVWLCITKASPCYLRSTAVLSSVIKVRRLLSPYLPLVTPKSSAWTR